MATLPEPRRPSVSHPSVVHHNPTVVNHHPPVEQTPEADKKEPAEADKPIGKGQDASKRRDPAVRLHQPRIEPEEPQAEEAPEAAEDRENLDESRKRAGKKRLPRPSAGKLLAEWKQKWSWRWGIPALLAPVFLLWLAPMIVAHTPLFSLFLNRATGDLNGSVSVRSASLGWFSPIVLGGVAVRDQEGRPLAEIAEVRGETSLLALLANSSQLGVYHVKEPKLTLVLRDNGSNLEDALANYLEPKEPKKNVDLALAIEDGSVTVEEPRTQRKWQIEKFLLNLALPANRAKPLDLETAGIVPEGSRAGRFSLAMKVQRQGQPEVRTASAAEQDSIGPDQLKLKAEGLSLAMFETIVRRFVPGAAMSGRVSASLEGHWDSRRPEVGIMLAGSVTGEKLLWGCKALGTDRPSLDRLQASGSMLWQNGQLRLEKVTAQSDLGNLTMAGVLDLNEAARGNSLAAIFRQNCDISGDLDLARLAAAMPGTLRIRKGTQITSGKVQLSFASRRGADGVAWTGRFETTNLTAKNKDRQLAWQQPIRIGLQARETRDGLSVQQLECLSDFLTAHAAGTKDKFTVSVNFDLSKLAEQSGGFIDLAGMRLTGDGIARFFWERNAEQAFEAKVMFQASGFQLMIPDRLTWKEDQLTANFTASGRADFANNNRLNFANVSVESASDIIKAQLVQPVVGLRSGRPWIWKVQSEGQLARWLPRISAWVNLNQWKSAGSYQLMSELSVSRDAIGLRNTEFTVTDLVLQGPQLNLREPQASLVLTGLWNRAGRRLELETARLTSAGAKAQADRFVLALPTQGPVELAGTLQAEMGLDRLQQWTTVGPPESLKWRLQGKLTARTDFQQTAGNIAAQFHAIVNDLLMTNVSGQRYQDREVSLIGSGSYNDLKGSIEIEKAVLSSGTLACSASGRLRRLEGQTDVQLNGRLDYDLDRLSELLRARFGEGIRIAGRGSCPVSYSGPLGSDKAVARASFNWASADLYGFQFGPGELQAAYSGGIVNVQPLSLDVNEGRVRLAPQARISPEPMLLAFVPDQTGVEKVRITPAMCSSALQYVAPSLAGVAQAEGRFSVELEGCQIPLANPAQTEIAGKLVFHSVQVGPGYLLQELATLFGGTATPAQLVKESVVPFRMTGGRIYHRDFRMTISNNIVINTYGSVGLDQSLSMMAEMPVPSGLQTGQLLASFLKDQKIQVPVVGTLRQPHIDWQAVGQIARQSAQSGLRNMLQDQIDRGVNRLLTPPTRQPATPPRK